MSSVPVSPFDELAQARTRYFVGSASDEPVEIQVCGITYRWEPHSQREITDRYDFQRDQKLNVLTREPMVVPKGGDAYSILKTIMSAEDGFQGAQKGLYLIRQDGRDMERYNAARQASLERRLERAKAGQRWWMSVLNKVATGDLPPVQPRHLREDLAFLAKYERGLIGRSRFIAWDGGFESDNRAEVEAYIAAHRPTDGRAPIIDRDALVPQVKSAPEQVPAAVLAAHGAVADLASAAPVAPRAPEEASAPSVADDEAEFLLTTAEELDVALTAAEVRAIGRRDRSAMMDVMTRLAAVKSQAKE